MNYIVADFEFNQPFDFQDGDKTLLDKKCPAEIIQIGAVKLNENYEFIGQLNLYARPAIYKRMHPMVERLTGISKTILSGQPHFPEAYGKFLQFIGKSESVLCTWGPDDAKELYRNILYYNLGHKYLTKKYINVQKLAGMQIRGNTRCSIGLKAAVEALEMDIGEPFHDALNDAVYTAHVFQKIDRAHMEIQTFDLERLKQKIYIAGCTT